MNGLGYVVLCVCLFIGDVFFVVVFFDVIIDDVVSDFKKDNLVDMVVKFNISCVS